ncbi:MAG: CmpA/NrtA family ABC transporter substrate-binding protein [Pseudomonadota bacterium]
MTCRLKLGFVPLTDAAPLIAARAQGYFRDEGLEVQLSREVSWATIRDKVAAGVLDGAHMLAPMAIAATLGVGSERAPMVVPLALGVNGAGVTLSTRLTNGGTRAEDLARLIARRRDEGASPLTFAVVFPYSIHNYLLRAWLAGAGVDPDADVRLIVAPPSRMAELLEAGVVEGFGAGEPWGALAESAGVGRVAVRAAEFWGRAPDKVFGVTEAWAAKDPARLAAVVRALSRGAAWCDAPGARAELAALLARPEYVDAPAGLIEPGLRHVVFHREGANSPRPEDAAWLIGQMVRWGQLGASVDAEAAARRIYRPEVYEAALAG